MGYPSEMTALFCTPFQTMLAFTQIASVPRIMTAMKCIGGSRCYLLRSYRELEAIRNGSRKRKLPL